MKVFEIITDGGAKAVHAKASTRAGLAVAALHGVSSLAGGSTSELDEKVERPFSVTADTFGALLTALLTRAATASATHAETYDDIQFTLITEKKAEGAFIGRPAKGVSTLGAFRTKGDVARNEAGEWETVIVIG